MVINLALGQVITEADMTQILASLHTSTETIQEQSDILLREDMAMDKYQDLAKQMKPEIIIRRAENPDALASGMNATSSVCPH